MPCVLSIQYLVSRRTQYLSAARRATAGPNEGAAADPGHGRIRHGYVSPARRPGPAERCIRSEDMKTIKPR